MGYVTGSVKDFTIRDFFIAYTNFFSLSQIHPLLYISRPHVPARYAIKFVPASDSSPVDNAVICSAVSPSTVYSVVSSANFVPALTVLYLLPVLNPKSYDGSCFD